MLLVENLGSGYIDDFGRLTSKGIAVGSSTILRMRVTALISDLERLC